MLKYISIKNKLTAIASRCVQHGASTFAVLPVKRIPHIDIDPFRYVFADLWQLRARHRKQEGPLLRGQSGVCHLFLFARQTLAPLAPPSSSNTTAAATASRRWGALPGRDGHSYGRRGRGDSPTLRFRLLTCS